MLKRCVFSLRLKLFRVGAALSSCGRELCGICGRRIHFMFGSTVGFSGSADRMALFTVTTFNRYVVENNVRGVIRLLFLVIYLLLLCYNCFVHCCQLIVINRPASSQLKACWHAAGVFISKFEQTYPHCKSQASPLPLLLLERQIKLEFNPTPRLKSVDALSCEI